MRISINPSDQAYSPKTHLYRVFLGEMELKFVHTADEEAKTAWGYISDSDGELLTRNLEPIHRKWVGDIRIVR